MNLLDTSCFRTLSRQRLNTLFIDGGGNEDGIRSVYKSNAFRINLFKDLKAHICKITHHSDKIVNLHNSLIVTGLVVSIAKISPNCRNLSAEADLNAHNWFLSRDTKYQIFCLNLTLPFLLAFKTETDLSAA